MRITRTIAFRLFLLITAVQLLILLGLTYATISVQQTKLMENVTQNAERVSDLIARSTRFSMLLNRNEDVQQIITSLGAQPGIEGIRIYSKQGQVVFGTQPAELFTKVDLSAEACMRCHATGDLDGPRTGGPDLSRIFTQADGRRVLGLITPIRNETDCATAACHAHPKRKTILGVVDVKVSLAQVDAQLAESRNNLILLSIGAVLLIGLVSGTFIWLEVRRPVRRLMLGMEMVAAGNLDHRLETRSRDELGQLARGFNEMTADLARARREITAWSDTLEQKVREKTADLERAHVQMMRVEKMASLGNLASSMAHELNNPLEGILTFARLLIKRIRKTSLPVEEQQTYITDLDLVAHEAQRCGNIVKNLLVFARQKGGEFQQARLRGVVERSVLLVKHHAQMRNVRIDVACTDDDLVECDADQIEQVLLALIMNAIEAMTGNPDRPQGGVLTLDVRRQDAPPAMMIRVADTGSGMSDEIKAHIFEPFFTTKSEGKGVGLGLAIVFGIIQRHRGTIDVESSVGAGTTFTLTLPVTSSAPVPAPASRPEQG
jgi:two-component system NtrC family sensor kinase